MFRRMMFWTVPLSLFSFSLFAQDMVPPAPPRDQGFTQTLVMLAVGICFFYFILWRPEQKRRREVEEQRNALAKGDRVTAMGIIGTVVKVQEHTVILRMYDGAKVEMLRAAVSEVHSSGEEPERGDSKRVPITSEVAKN